MEQLGQIFREVYWLEIKKAKPKRLDTTQSHVYNFFKNYKIVQMKEQLLAAWIRNVGKEERLWRAIGEILVVM